MERQYIRFILYFLICLLSVLHFSCSDYKQSKYVARIKKNITEFDSVTATLLAKYSSHSLGSITVVYPSEQSTYSNDSRVFDTSINNFCNKHDITYIQIQSVAENMVDVTYYMSNTNYQYIYNGRDKSDRKIFENTRVRIVPINERWTFQYEKPNF